MQSHYSYILQIMASLNSRVMSMLKWTNLERITTTEVCVVCGPNKMC